MELETMIALKLDNAGYGYYLMKATIFLILMILLADAQEIS